jgi:nucleobase transporter 1/2
MNSPRNIFIGGFGLYMALSVPDYFTSYAAANKGSSGPINTPNTEFNGAHAAHPGILGPF